ncbi:TPA: GspN family type II secretion system protein ExeN [Aeromonas salmonicida]|uniref:GspN family type II secretion system protein ExeN n=1 Tax=Aeromonas salmonicida TaxID=645 RepID=UPI0004473FDB|nr:GspN family type II secretion system protein ExeN [Aeromonas salmonicida]ASI24669.1 type II secretion protein N [Aeromonas salmonicida]ASI28988.1 type II secretion protein N [Aeromonas salmonicida]ASI33118.1 type II secretion protein N [Aeromonas salmonicida]ATD36685.1 type II secretion protein N [Aeromonas salmonicida subsp. masoucida]ELI6404838.1 GspN family type II secretion system protein ExeN [Aeromonas salmonicida subsp. salmonicida]
MKKKVLIAALFLVAYLGFLLVKLPATLVVRHLPLLPNLVQLEGVSGTLWSGQVARLQYASESLTQLRWELNGWSLLRFAPEVFLRFGDRSGLNGQGVVGWNGAAFGRDITLNVPAPWVLDRVPMRLPFPLTVAGQLQLKVDQFAQGNPWCDNLYGNLYWYGADADTSAGKLPLGDPEIKLTCIDSRLVAELKQSSEAVQVMGKLELQANRQYLFQGSLKPGPELPEEMKQGLPFLGQPDGQGRFPLRYQGRI